MNLNHNKNCFANLCGFNQEKAEYGIKDKKGIYWETVAILKYEDAEVIEIYEDLPSKITVDFLIKEGFLKRPYQGYQVGGF